MEQLSGIIVRRKIKQVFVIFLLICVPAIMMASEPARDSVRDIGPDEITWYEMNQSVMESVTKSEGAIDHVNKEILSMYQDDREFIDKYEKAEEAWFLLFQADFNIKYNLGEQKYYHKKFPECFGKDGNAELLKRAAFLETFMNKDTKRNLCSKVELKHFDVDRDFKCIENSTGKSERESCAKSVFSVFSMWKLRKIYREITQKHSDNPAFIELFNTMQTAWSKSLEADVKLITHNQEQAELFIPCEYLYKTRMTLARVEFLKRWLVDLSDDNICDQFIIGK